MDSLLKLDLQPKNETPAAENLPKPEAKEPQPPLMGKRVHRLINKGAHKAAAQYGRSSSGIFSK
ncbi:MAG TPA: hypothetical protein VKR52_01020 [Terracidiphilus sp.]|nr:hypothetical protein [Terracidiphilus sp.]